MFYFNTLFEGPFTIQTSGTSLVYSGQTGEELDVDERLEEIQLETVDESTPTLIKAYN